MIFDLHQRWAFIHIPRSAGTAITETLRADNKTADILWNHHRHATIADLERLIGWQALTHLRIIAVRRNPWHRIESDYSWTLDQIEAGTIPPTANPLWSARLLRTAHDPRFDRFLDEEILGPHSGIQPTGYETTWLKPYPRFSTFPMTIIPYETLNEAWPAIAPLISPTTPTTLPRRNESLPRFVNWTPDQIRRVAELCSADLDAADHRPPTPHQ